MGESHTLGKVALLREDGSKPKLGTNSSCTGTKIVPVRKKNPLSSKTMNPRPQNIQNREIVVVLKVKNIYET